ncbi:MAG TPA: Gfo/Idh/MocA family oxidoreductase [Planctomycetota bacterium]|nr:Gfo/Idh/MocA family oxidoreductase [Planctomycetota bacterium]
MNATASATRREFIRRAAAASATTLAAPHVLTSAALGGPGAAPASDRVRVGFIGTGGHGIGRNLQGFLGQRDAAVAALCDVDDGCLARGVHVTEQAYKNRGLGDELTSILKTKDWRQVIERPEVDAVMVSAPDHWHCLMSAWAVRAGKDVICEKPTYCIAEGRALADTVKRYGAVFQTSTEDRSIGIYHRLAEVVRNQLIGKLQRIELTLPAAPGSPGDPTPQPVPPGLDWDMWLGPAAWAPYCPGRVHFNFRYCANTGAGILADWGCHQCDTAQWANDTERSGPVEIEGTGQRFGHGLYDTFHTYDITYRYASGVVFHIKSGGTGLRFEGTDGWVESPSWCAPIRASRPELLTAPVPVTGVHLFTCPAGEHRNFLDCVKTRRDPYFPAEVGHRCASVCHLGTISMLLRRKLTWDPVAEEFPGDPEANRLRSRPMREPWTL